MIPRLRIVRDTATPGFRRFAARIRPRVQRVIDRDVSKLAVDIQRTLPRLSGVLAASYRTRRGKLFGQHGSALERARFTEFGTSRSPAQKTVHKALRRARTSYLGRVKAAFRSAVR